MIDNQNNIIPLPLILDGATGTELSKRGMKPSDCTERFVLENPEILRQLQCEYIKAGSDAVLAPTFGANAPTLMRHGYNEDDIDGVCRALFKISKGNNADAKIGGDMSPTGLLLKPYGEAEPEEVFNIYRRQAAVLLDCGVDFFFVETMISAAEARLAVRAIRDISKDIPVFVSLTVNENGRTVNGDVTASALLTMVDYDIQGFGCNCSIGPDVVANALTCAAPIAKLYGIPLIAKPNAGMPITDESGTHFSLSPEDMANAVERLTGLGVGIFGGCCGTTPDHIAEIAKAAKSAKKQIFEDVKAAEQGTYVSTSRVWASVDENAEYTYIESEDDIYNILDESDADEVLYFEVGAGAADMLINMDAFIPNPICLRGDESEIEKIEKTLCRKVR